MCRVGKRRVAERDESRRLAGEVQRSLRDCADEMDDCFLDVPLEVAGADRPVGCHVRSQGRGRELRGNDKIAGLDHVHVQDRIWRRHDRLWRPCLDPTKWAYVMEMVEVRARATSTYVHAVGR